MLAHTQHYHAHRGAAGLGHLYQGRFMSFPVEEDDYFQVVCRYVERNALKASLVQRAEAYRWGSLWNWLNGDSLFKWAAWPVRRLPKWVDRVNETLTEKRTNRINA